MKLDSGCLFSSSYVNFVSDSRQENNELVVLHLVAVGRILHGVLLGHESLDVQLIDLHRFYIDTCESKKVASRLHADTNLGVFAARIGKCRALSDLGGCKQIRAIAISLTTSGGHGRRSLGPLAARVEHLTKHRLVLGEDFVDLERVQMIGSELLTLELLARGYHVLRQESLYMNKVSQINHQDRFVALTESSVQPRMDLGHLVLGLSDSDEYLHELVTVQLAIVLVLEAVDAGIGSHECFVKRSQREVSTEQLGAVAILLEVLLTDARIILAVGRVI